MDRLTRLDGLRAIAVIAVIQQHWGPALINQIGPGGFGVNCFFVLSGFLITSMLLRARDAGDRLSGLTVFYVRRALRIFPAYYAMILVASLITEDVRRDWPWHAAYLSNMKLAIDQAWPGSAAHLWSLSVEEQFYLLWPALVLFLPRHSIDRTILALVLTAPLARFVVLTATGGNQFAAANSLVGAIDCLALGGWLACRRLQSDVPLPRWLFGAGAAVWILGWVIARIEPGSRIPLLFGGTSAALMFVWVIDRVSANARGTEWLAWRPLVYIGTVSYGVYLVHNFVPRLTTLVAPGVGSWMYQHGVGPLVAITIVSIALASASWYLVERPVSDLKRYFPYGRTFRNRGERQADGPDPQRELSSAAYGPAPYTTFPPTIVSTDSKLPMRSTGTVM
jgi:peptidoglycan/LPS O-acetylase OafA/YrhL